MGWNKTQSTHTCGQPQAHMLGNAPGPSGKPQAHKDWEGGVESSEPLAHNPGIHGEPSARDADEVASGESTVRQNSWPSSDSGRACTHSHNDESDGCGEPLARTPHGEAQRAHTRFAESRLPEREGAKTPTIYNGS